VEQATRYAAVWCQADQAPRRGGRNPEWPQHLRVAIGWPRKMPKQAPDPPSQVTANY
jgi:hypothetical protein